MHRLHRTAPRSRVKKKTASENASCVFHASLTHNRDCVQTHHAAHRVSIVRVSFITSSVCDGDNPCERWPETPAGLFGWQGIVPCKVRKMSTTMVDLMTKRLLDVRAVFGGVRGCGGPSVHLTRTLTHSSVHVIFIREVEVHTCTHPRHPWVVYTVMSYYHAFGPVVHSSVHSLVHSLVHSFVHSLVHWSIHSSSCIRECASMTHPPYRVVLPCLVVGERET